MTAQRHLAASKTRKAERTANRGSASEPGKELREGETAGRTRRPGADDEARVAPCDARQCACHSLQQQSFGHTDLATGSNSPLREPLCRGCSERHKAARLRTSLAARRQALPVGETVKERRSQPRIRKAQRKTIPIFTKSNLKYLHSKIRYGEKVGSSLESCVRNTLGGGGEEGQARTSADAGDLRLGPTESGSTFLSKRELFSEWDCCRWLASGLLKFDVPLTA